MPVRAPPSLASFLLIAFLSISSASFASSVVQRSIADIVSDSPLVFEGKVSSVNTVGRGKQIFTWVTFDVLDVIKGETSKSHIELRYIGGTVEGRTLSVGGQTIPDINEHGIYFVESLESRKVHPLTGWGQGHFILELDPKSQNYIVKNSEKKSVTSLSATKGDKALSLNAKSAAGVETASENQATEGETALTREEFKLFIRELEK